MNNTNQAFIKLYTERGTPRRPIRQGQAVAPETPEAAVLRHAQPRCVVGSWSDNDVGIDRASAVPSHVTDGEDLATPPPGTLGAASHLPAVLAAAAIAAEGDGSETDGAARGVKFSQRFVQLPEPEQRDRQEPRHDRTHGAESSPKARVVTAIDPSHTVAQPHFEPAAAKTESELAQQDREQDSPASSHTSRPDSNSATGELRPAWEVDSFEWPDTVGRVFSEKPDCLDSLVSHIVQLADVGSKRIAVVGSQPGVGNTTLTLCLARRLSQVVEKVALVDGNLSRPQLAAEFDIQLETGWEEVLADRKPAEEAAIASVEDGITLLPVTGGTPPVLADVVAARAAAVIRNLATNHDVVIVDGGWIGRGSEASVIAGDEQPAVDAAVIVCDARQPAQRQLRETVAELAAQGIPAVAVAENFPAAADATSFRRAA